VSRSHPFPEPQIPSILINVIPPPAPIRPKIMEFRRHIAGIDNDKRVWSSNVQMLPAPDINDDDLMVRLRAGDEEAFTFVFRRWQGPLFRFALHMSGNRTVAEDATQEVFMTLIRQTAQFDSAKGKLGAFLFGIARNQVLKRLERERPYTSLTPNWEDAAEARDELRIHAGDATRSDHEARAEAIEQVRHAIPTLPPDYREVVALCDLEEMSYEEAAAALGCAPGTVASRLHRGRTLLAAKLRNVHTPAAKKVSPVAVLSAPPNRNMGNDFISAVAAKLQAQKAPK
jgi:RNA polymerase sigma-70 factor, ECF subfamily